MANINIDDKRIDELAHLARLEFNDEEKVQIKSDLEKIITFYDKLQEIDTQNVEPLIYMTDRQNNLREDIVEEPLSKKMALDNAPVNDSDYFKVPKFIKK